MAEELFFSGADVLVTIKDTVLSGLSYIQIVPQQPVVPVYSVFSTRPTAVLKGRFSVRGTIAFNLQFSQPFKHLSKIPNLNVHEIGENLYYIDKLTITIQNESAQPFLPVINLDGVYVTGGTVNAIQDGNPLQDVYQFVALNMSREDKILDGGGDFGKR